MFFAHLQKGRCIWRDRRQQYKHRAGHIPTFAFEFLLWEDAVQWHELAGADLWLLPPSLCHLLLAYSRKQINITDSICKANNFSQGLGSCCILTGSRYLPVCASTTARGVHAGWRRHQKEEILHYMMTGTVNSGPCGGTGTRPDLTCYTGNGMMWWTRSHALSKLESLQCWAVGLALRKLELLHCKLPVILSKENLTMSSDIIRCHNPMEVTWINTCWAQVRSLQCIVSFLCIRTSSGAGLSLILSRSMTTLSRSLFLSCWLSSVWGRR